MIREIVRPASEYINIKVPQEYIGKDIEVLLFSNSEINKVEVKQNSNECLEELERATRNPIKLSKGIKYELKMEDEVNNDLF